MISLDFALEWLGALSGLACVILTARRRILCWPVGLVSVVCYAVFFARIQLYADTALQGFFFATGLYGWWHWKHGGDHGGLAPIRVLPPRSRWRLAALLALAVPPVAWLLHRHTEASLPYLDTTVAALSVTAQLLLMRKYFDAWAVWIAVDVLSLVLYSLKEAWVTVGLYAIFLGLATAGHFAWRAALRRGVTI